MRRLVMALAAALALLTGARAEAYCRSAACASRGEGSSDGHVCDPPQPDDCGVALQWRQPCIGFTVQAGASAQVDEATAVATLTRAFDAWLAVDCGGLGTPSISVFDLGEVSCGKVEYNQHAGNANVLTFRDDAWPHADEGAGSADTLALTTVTYDVDKGDIYDADIEVNTANDRFTTTDAPGLDDVDLLSVLTHEAGHFLGLAHSAEGGTTMYPDYSRGTTSIRVLAADDEIAICLAYPPDRTATGDCTGIPRHGFAPECNDAQTYTKCSAAPAGPVDADGSGAHAWGALLAITLAAVRRGAARRRSGRSPIETSSPARR